MKNAPALICLVLTVAGADGSLRHRMESSVTRGNVRAKTGYMENDRSLSGCATTADGEQLALSMFANHLSVPITVVESVREAVCTSLCKFSRK